MVQLGFLRTAVAAIVAAGALAFAAVQPTRADVISDTPTLPLLNVPYVTSSASCFPAVGVCVSDGASILTPPSSSVFDATGQHITTGVIFSATLTDLLDVPIAPVELTGTAEQLVIGRTSPTETGSWDTELVSLSLSGSVLGFPVTVGLDSDPANPSVGETSITPIGLDQFRISSFFDVFVEITVDGTTPLRTTLGPIHAEAVQAVPEPSSMAALAIALPIMLALYRRRGSAFPATRSV
jgi:hypothetical protein